MTPEHAPAGEGVGPDDASSAWISAVETYVGELESLATKMQDSMDNLRIGVTERGPAAITPAVIDLARMVDTLQTYVARRDELLTDASAPTPGLTLRAKLSAVDDDRAADLADRCREVGRSIAETHQRATSLFVCQYHLSELTADLVRTLTRRQGGPTYDTRGETHRPSGDGGLLDRAA